MPILPDTDHDDSQERSRRQILYYSRIGPGQRTVTGASQRAKAFRHAVPQRIGSRSPIPAWWRPTAHQRVTNCAVGRSLGWPVFSRVASYCRHQPVRSARTRPLNTHGFRCCPAARHWPHHQSLAQVRPAGTGFFVGCWRRWAASGLQSACGTIAVPWF